MLSDYSGIDSGITIRKVTRKSPNACKLSNLLLINPQVYEETKIKVRKHFELDDNENILFYKEQWPLKRLSNHCPLWKKNMAEISSPQSVEGFVYL